MSCIPIYLAHGAGAGHQSSRFLQVFRDILVSLDREVTPVTFDYMEEQERSGKKRPPPRFEKLVPEFANAISTKESVVVAGKSMGGRVATQLSGEDNVKAIICLGFPFHPPGKQDKHRLAFLENVTVPCLIIQGTRDPFGKPEWVNQQSFNDGIEVQWIEGADHDFKTLKKQGLSQKETVIHVGEIITSWLVKIGLDA